MWELSRLDPDGAISEQHVTSLLSSSVTEETLATDRSIEREHVQSLYKRVVAKGDRWDVVKLFEVYNTRVHFSFFLEKNRERTTRGNHMVYC